MFTRRTGAFSPGVAWDEARESSPTFNHTHLRWRGAKTLDFLRRRGRDMLARRDLTLYARAQIEHPPWTLRSSNWRRSTACSLKRSSWRRPSAFLRFPPWPIRSGGVISALQAKAKAILEDSGVSPALSLYRRRIVVEPVVREVEIRLAAPPRLPHWQEPVLLKLPVVVWSGRGKCTWLMSQHWEFWSWPHGQELLDERIQGALPPGFAEPPKEGWTGAFGGLDPDSIAQGRLAPAQCAGADTQGNRRE